jgi:hypothetical protein
MSKINSLATPKVGTVGTTRSNYGNCVLLFVVVVVLDIKVTLCCVGCSLSLLSVFMCR